MSINKGWSLVGTTEAIDLNSSITDDLYIFRYKNKTWSVFPKIENYSHTNKIDSHQGFWIYSKIDKKVSFITLEEEDKNMALSQGWNLISFENNTSIKNIFTNGKLISSWKYTNNQWQYNILDNNHSKKILQSRFSKFDTVESHEGVWVNMKEPRLLLKNTIEFSYRTQRDVNITIISSSPNLHGKQILLFEKRSVIPTPVGELKQLLGKLTSKTFDKNGEFNYIHTIGNHINSLWLSIPFLYIEKEIQITNNKIEIKIVKGELK